MPVSLSTRDGLVLRPLPFDEPAAVERVIRQLLRARWIWDDVTWEHRQQEIRRMLYEDLLIDLDGLGLIWFDQIVPGMSCRVHALAWSRQLAGRDDVLLLACLAPVELLQVERIYAEIPEWLPGVLKSAQRVMEFEGRLRHTLVRNNTWYNTYVLSLLADDVRSRCNELFAEGASVQGLPPGQGDGPGA